ncbi:MAG: 50S ribosomal protein L6 [Candidatus Yanofskybacteria bacterium]|nr:50S ribosomal protein L6 [Candidatus Yanofskybacteria bacterium]
MSKIGKKPILIPSGVDVTIDGEKVMAKGPKGELTYRIHDVLTVRVEDGKVLVAPKENNGEHSVAWGLDRALINNMIVGVSEGFQKILELQGVGYKAAVKGDVLELNLGYSHPIAFSIPEGIAISVEKNILKINGIDKDLVGYTAAEIRSLREPEPYKGSGVRYSDEVIKLKPGKKAVAAG